MSESIKATRATVAIGALIVDGFMLPDGSYRMSQTQAAETVGKDEINARRFLTSKSINAIRGEGYTPDMRLSHFLIGEDKPALMLSPWTL